ncbi:helix-turn-helix transcriptional regulator [bacterium]|nr:helix-turn-helix transcriptional regulator [bacterium]
MSAKNSATTAIDQHIGQRLQLRRTMMGLSQKDLAKICGVTFQQIQKYESAGNRISASRLFAVSAALQTPVSFFFSGLPGNMPEETRTNRSLRVSEQQANDPLSRNESLMLVNMYWKLRSDDQRKTIMKLLRSLTNND